MEMLCSKTVVSTLLFTHLIIVAFVTLVLCVNLYRKRKNGSRLERGIMKAAFGLLMIHLMVLTVFVGRVVMVF